MNLLQALVKPILENPLDRSWSLQGLGMLRTYLDEDHVHRLHVWTIDVANEIGASELHTHPWDFHSEVVAGVVCNTRFKPWPINIAGQGELPMKIWQVQKIKCGEGGCLVGEPSTVELCEGLEERYGNDKPNTVYPCRYEQKAGEIHRSKPLDGTVSIITRHFNSDTEHAYVYFPQDEEWISAEPRPATDDEIVKITRNSLEKWF